MTTQQFMQVAPKITATGLFTNLEKGQHGANFLGHIYFGTTESHYKTIWRKYRTLANMIITKTANETNDILKAHGITEFIAVPTKSKTMCRLQLVK